MSLAGISFEAAMTREQAELAGLSTRRGLPAPPASSVRSSSSTAAAGASGGRWQYGLVCDYESPEHLQAYYSTPEHAVVVDEIVPLIADRAICDFEL